MENIPLAYLSIQYGQQQTCQLEFSQGTLVIITEYGDKHWYMDVEGILNRELLAWFGQSENIKIALTAEAVAGERFQGDAYLHPNEGSQSAAIRGVGELRQL